MINLESKDLALFRSYIQEFAESRESNILKDMADTSYILRIWNENKSEYLAKVFGDKLILEREVEYIQSTAQIRDAIEQEMYSVDGNDMAIFRSMYLCRLENYFDRFAEEYRYARKLLDPQTLAENNTSAFYCPTPIKLTFPSGNTVTITEGAKAMRLLGKICKEIDMEKDFEEFRLKHSLFLNQKKVKGTLCLSIHPMDYVTMSDNANDWSSCITWEDDGYYRGGTVEMMNSPCVVVAYLKSHDKEFTWGVNEAWNSKLWRTLMVVTPKVITTVKSYPYYHEELLKTCAEWMRDLVTNALGWDYSSNCQEILTSGMDVRLSFSTDRMYNDFGCVTHWGYIGEKCPSAADIYYSGPSQCMICGEVRDEYDYYDSNFVVCRDCCDSDYDCHYNTCYECGDRIDSDDTYWVEDEPLCEYCFNLYANECAFSGEYFFTDNLERVYLAEEDDKPTIDDQFLYVSYRYLKSAPYENDVWIKQNCTHSPRCYESLNLSYWNKSDWTKKGLFSYWGLEKDS